ncbi:MAG: folate-binding protein [Paracoccus sp. (in: a-proteobacteria)]|uniref:CAF17-like 4Fe-4S cluster assembly/insertion protein YgfZ n=1 Tax=Paracoccus sp. TaxID=267 RepID=UPI0026DEAC50|nr:folate-binding protein [Paracoccus sp. (in: a-proteobacteria)]MDO5620564.1 folate-binding protein [Paracoccus sp. (in: a-proteobacteria)]
MTERFLIHVTGADAADFLQGLVSNDIRRAPVWAALLTAQGKYLADFFVIPWDGGFLLDADPAQGPGLLQRLNMYRLRSAVTLTPLDLPVTHGIGPAPEGAIPDPRHLALGWRGYGVGADDGTDWDALRVDLAVPQAGVELTPDSYILEMGFDRLHGVDYRKGCYVGQEVTARMHHKTELRKGLRRVLIAGAAPVGSPILTEDGREAGTVYTQSGGRALAYIRFDRLAAGLRAGDAVIAPDPDDPAAP